MNKIAASLLLILLLLSGCKATGQMAPADTDGPSFGNAPEEADIKKKSGVDRAEAFLAGFSQNYPEFKLRDHVLGDAANTPIILAGVAESTADGTSSTLFIVDENGSGQLKLAADSYACYRSEDELKLSGNTVLLALDVQVSNEEGSTGTQNEIHDFEITVTQERDEGDVLRTHFESKDTIRGQNG